MLSYALVCFAVSCPICGLYPNSPEKINILIKSKHHFRAEGLEVLGEIVTRGIVEMMTTWVIIGIGSGASARRDNKKRHREIPAPF